jgi:biopolymer transport protein ExbD
MSRERKARHQGEDPKLEMTPMIDVVFQLLIFFVVTLKQEDIFAHIDITRPQPQPEDQRVPEVDDLLKITVFPGGYVTNGTLRDLRGTRTFLSKIARFNKNLSVIVMCTADSKHGDLIKLLDICAENKLLNISVFSL